MGKHARRRADDPGGEILRFPKRIVTYAPLVDVDAVDHGVGDDGILRITVSSYLSPEQARAEISKITEEHSRLSGLTVPLGLAVAWTLRGVHTVTAHTGTAAAVLAVAGAVVAAVVHPGGGGRVLPFSAPPPPAVRVPGPSLRPSPAPARAGSRPVVPSPRAAQSSTRPPATTSASDGAARAGAPVSSAPTRVPQSSSGAPKSAPSVAAPTTKPAFCAGVGVLSAAKARLCL